MADKGRPNKLTKEVSDLFFDRFIELGSVALACDTDKLPTKRTIFSWLSKGTDEESGDYHDFLHRYTKAQKISADYEIDGIIEDIRKNAQTPVLVDGVPLTIDGKQVYGVTGPSVGLAKIIYDATKWRASKRNFKYTDGQHQEDDTPATPIQISFNVNEPVGDIKVTNAKS